MSFTGNARRERDWRCPSPVIMPLRRSPAARLPVHIDHARQRWFAAWRQAWKKEGVGFAAYRMAVADYDACQHRVMRMLGDTGRIDILLNNAGIMRDAQ